MVVDQAPVAVRTVVPSTAVADTAPMDRGRDRVDPAPAQARPASAPAWYPDPRSSSSLRWWDGEAWTVHVTPYPGGDGPPAEDAEACAMAGVTVSSGHDDDVAPVPTETVAPPLTGDIVRQTALPTVRRGYDRLEVDPFLLLLAAELDACRSPGPLLSRASFSCSRPGYDRQEVERLLVRADPPEGGPAGDSSDPGPASGQTVPRRARRSGRAGGTPGSTGRGVQARKAKAQKVETEECEARWSLLDSGPGLAMDMKRTDGGWMLVAPSGAVLATIDDALWFDERPVLMQHRPNVWRDRLPTAVHVDQQDYTVQAVGEPAAGREAPSPDLRLPHVAVVDPSGRAVLQLVGQHFNRKATSIVRRPSGELIQFPVHETALRNAVMDATEGSGRVILRFRDTRQGRQAFADPSVPVTSDIVLLVVLASTFLPGYFRTPWGAA